jgi:hypothetical protein
VVNAGTGAGREPPGSSGKENGDGAIGLPAEGVINGHGKPRSTKNHNRNGKRKRAGGRASGLLAALIGAAGAVVAAVVGAYATGAFSSSPSPQPSPGPLIAGDNSSFIRDITYPDGSTVLVNQHFVKKWELLNSGSVNWNSRYLIPLGRVSGDCTYPPRVSVPGTPPGGTATISVQVTAPAIPGSCFVNWQMVNASGKLYFPNYGGIWFSVRVAAAKKS